MRSLRWGRGPRVDTVLVGGTLITDQVFTPHALVLMGGNVMVDSQLTLCPAVRRMGVMFTEACRLCVDTLTSRVAWSDEG